MDIQERLTAFAMLGATWVMYLLVVLSILGLAIILERTYYFIATRDDVNAPSMSCPCVPSPQQDTVPSTRSAHVAASPAATAAAAPSPDGATGTGLTAPRPSPIRCGG